MMQHGGIKCMCSLVRLTNHWYSSLWLFIFIPSATVLHLKSPAMWAECCFI